MTTLNCCVLHSVQQRFPCRSSKTKCLAHASPCHLMICTTSSNLDAKQLAFHLTPLCLPSLRSITNWLYFAILCLYLLSKFSSHGLVSSSMMIVFVSIDHTTPSGREPSPGMIAISEGNSLSFLGMSTHSIWLMVGLELRLRIGSCKARGSLY